MVILCGAVGDGVIVGDEVIVGDGVIVDEFPVGRERGP